MEILKLVDVTKQYDKKLAVDKVSFDMPKGCIFGLLGPNGAGKTSLIRIITTITGADTGTVYLDGTPIDSDTPSHIGYMPEERGLYKKMKVGEQLMYLAQLKGLSARVAREKIMHWFEKFDILPWWDKKIEELSKGMQQKIQFISTVVHEPKLLILDEPFSGLDPLNTNLIKDEIRKLNQAGSSIIFSTHRMEQVEEICERIILIDNGQKILEGTVADIKDQFKENLFEIQYEGALPEDLNNYGTMKSSSGNSFVIKKMPDQQNNSILQYLIDNDVRIRAYNEILPSLNEIFIRQVEAQS
ncbi:MAG: ATP-binding cassette domain-containing protein [Bacteroidia bacterium]|nr:ATP-binding cassette domain-containing protein [Bacteroidia bacterium]